MSIVVARPRRDFVRARVSRTGNMVPRSNYNRINPVTGDLLYNAGKLGYKVYNDLMGPSTKRYSRSIGKIPKRPASAPYQKSKAEPLKVRKNDRHTPNKPVGRIAKMEKKLNDICEVTNNNISTFTEKKYEGTNLVCAVGQQSWLSLPVGTGTDFRSIMTGLRYWNVTTNTYDTVNIGASNGATNLDIHYQCSKLEIKNNYQVPVRVNVYIAHTKVDTNLGSLDYLLADIPSYSNMTTKEQLGVYLTDSQLVRTNYNVKKMVTTILAPGESVKTNHTEKNCRNIDMEWLNATGGFYTYAKKLHSYEWIINIEGCPSHSSTIFSQVSNASAAVDIIYEDQMKCKYQGGSNSTYLRVTDARDKSGIKLQSQQTCDNQAYSAS